MGMKFLIFRSIVPMIRFDSAEWKKNYFDAYKGHATMLTSNPFTEQMKHSIQVEFVSREPTLRGVMRGRVRKWAINEESISIKCRIFLENFLYCSSNFNGNGHLNTRTSTSNMKQTSNDEAMRIRKKLLVFTVKYTENNNENKTIKQVRRRKKAEKLLRQFIVCCCISINRNSPVHTW